MKKFAAYNTESRGTNVTWVPNQPDRRELKKILILQVQYITCSKLYVQLSESTRTVLVQSVLSTI
jgi:hypothetical protein